MLKKLYVAGSLEQTDGGFKFALKNTLATATITAPPEISIDGDAIDPSKVTFSAGGETAQGDEIGEGNTYALEKGTEVGVDVGGFDLADGAHKIGIKVTSKEWDTLDFTVEDTA